MEHLGVGVGSDENIAVGEQEIVVTDEGFGDLGGFAGAILNGLAGVTDPRAEGLAIAEMVFDDLGVPAGDDADFANAALDQPGEDVFEDGFALDGQHRFGDLLGEIAHAGAFTGGEDDGFHGSVGASRTRLRPARGIKRWRARRRICRTSGRWPA